MKDTLKVVRNVDFIIMKLLLELGTRLKIISRRKITCSRSSIWIMNKLHHDLLLHACIASCCLNK